MESTNPRISRAARARFDPAIFESKIATMASILHHVSHSYYFWTCGEVPANRALDLAGKFADLYSVDRTANQRYRARARGEANAVLLMYPIAGTRMLRWWLLATPGAGAIHERERLRDTRKTGQRLRWSDEYEVSKVTKKGREKPSWSWRLTKDNWDAWRERIRRASISTDASRMRQAMWSLWRSPGFGGVRQQVGHLLHGAKEEWKRRKKNRDFPAVPPVLPYVTYREADAQPLSVLVYRAAKGRAEWFGSDRRGVRIGADTAPSHPKKK